MPRYTRNAVILAKIETTAGTDASPAASTDALLVSDLTPMTIEAQNVDRSVIRGTFGASEQLVATRYKRLSFSVEFAGSGTAGTAPAWGKLLQACGVAEAVLASPARVEYTPVSTSLKTLSIYYYDDGALHKLLGSMGNVRLSARAGEIPRLQFDFLGVDGGDSATANPSPTLTAWKTPITMAKANVVDVTVGATYAAGALTGGTVYPSTGLEVDFGNQVNFTPLLSSESIDLTNRSVSGRVMLDLTAAQEIAQLAIVNANTTASYALTIGSTAGSKLIIHAPAVQLINPRKGELNGRRMISYDMRMVPVAGNDELRIAHV